MRDVSIPSKNQSKDDLIEFEKVVAEYDLLMKGLTKRIDL